MANRSGTGMGEKKTRRRGEKTEETRRRLFDAALKVVGESGYSDTLVSKVTDRAKVAQGTFYSYFTSQQDMFDQLLPNLGDRLLSDIRDRLASCRDSFEREEIGFRTYFEFLARNPEFERIYSEAEIFAPQGFQDHIRNIVRGYRRSFRRSIDAGLLPHYSERELEAVTYMLLGARTFLSKRYMTDRFGGIPTSNLPDWVVAAYMKFFRYGLTGPRRGSAQSTLPIRESTELEPEILERSATTTRLRLLVPANSGMTTFAIANELVRLAATYCIQGRSGMDVAMPQGFSCHFLAPITVDPIIAVAKCLSPSDSTSSVHVGLEQSDRRIAEALVLFAGQR